MPEKSNHRNSSIEKETAQTSSNSLEKTKGNLLTCWIQALSPLLKSGDRSIDKKVSLILSLSFFAVPVLLLSNNSCIPSTILSLGAVIVAVATNP